MGGLLKLVMGLSKRVFGALFLILLVVYLVATATDVGMSASQAVREAGANFREFVTLYAGQVTGLVLDVWHAVSEQINQHSRNR